MKKWILLFLMIIIPLQVYAEECSNENVTIQSITLEETSDSASEKEPAEIKNNVIKLNLHMANESDYVTYKIKIKNSSSENYEFNSNNLEESEYLKYIISSSDNSHVIGPGTEKVFTLKVEYIKKVPSSMLDDGEYQENKNVTLNIKTVVLNPKTGRKVIIYGVILLIVLSEILMLILAKKKNKGLIALLIGISIAIPTYVYAECQLDYKLDTKVTLADYYYVYTANIYDANDKPNTTIYIGDRISSQITQYKTPEEAMDALYNASGRVRRNFFLRHKIKNGRVEESYVGFVKNGEIYYLRGGVDETETQSANGPEIALANVDVLNEAFGNSKCEFHSDYYRCSDNNNSARSYINGYEYVRDDEYFCHVRYDERSTCGTVS